MLERCEVKLVNGEDRKECRQYYSSCFAPANNADDDDATRVRVQYCTVDGRVVQGVTQKNVTLISQHLARKL